MLKDKDVQNLQENNVNNMMRVYGKKLVMNNLRRSTNPDADSKKRERTTGDI